MKIRYITCTPEEDGRECLGCGRPVHTGESIAIDRDTRAVMHEGGCEEVAIARDDIEASV